MDAVLEIPFIVILNGGRLNYDLPEFVTRNCPNFIFPIPTRAGYEFVRWSMGSANGFTVTQLSDFTLTRAAIEIYANWCNGSDRNLRWLIWVGVGILAAVAVVFILRLVLKRRR